MTFARYLVPMLLGAALIGCQSGCERYDVTVPKPLPSVPGGVKLTIGSAQLMVEVVKTNEDRRLGLMYRKTMHENAGMLFAYAEEDYRSFWMRDTVIPLTIAYLDKGGMILQMEDLTPRDETSVPSRAPAKYALEVNRGWFRKNNVRVGDKVEGASRFTGE